LTFTQALKKQMDSQVENGTVWYEQSMTVLLVLQCPTNTSSQFAAPCVI